MYATLKSAAYAVVHTDAGPLDDITSVTYCRHLEADPFLSANRVRVISHRGASRVLSTSS